MHTLTKLRLTHLAFGLAACFTMGSLAAMLVNFTVTVDDPRTGAVTTIPVFGREWYEAHVLGLVPQQGIVIGVIAMGVLACLYEYYYSRTTKQAIEAANQAARAFLQRNWWKLGLLIVVLSLLLTELTIRHFSL